MISIIEKTLQTKQQYKSTQDHLKDIYGDSLKNKDEYYYSSADDSSRSSSNFGISEDEECLIELFHKH